MTLTKLAVIGSGPAGYTAAIYAARAQLKPIVFTGVESGGQLMYTSELENFPGFPEGIIGPKFMTGLRAQAERFGAKIEDKSITAVDLSAHPFKLWASLPEGVSAEIFKTGSVDKIKEVVSQVKLLPHDLEASSVIIATGATAITLGLPGEAKFFGRGVSTCAICDAPFYKGKNVYVVGGGDAAMEEALALAKFTDRVTILHRRDKFKASRVMQDRVLNHDKIKVMWNSALKEILGGETVEKIKVEVEGREQELPAEGVFLAIGHRPVNNLFIDQLELDAKGYIVTRVSLSKLGLDRAQQALSEQQLVTYPSMTSVEGVFAGGDIVDIRYKQAVTAAGQGCAAALDAEQWLEIQE